MTAEPLAFFLSPSLFLFSSLSRVTVREYKTRELKREREREYINLIHKRKRNEGEKGRERERTRRGPRPTPSATSPSLMSRSTRLCRLPSSSALSAVCSGSPGSPLTMLHSPPTCLAAFVPPQPSPSSSDGRHLRRSSLTRLAAAPCDRIITLGLSRNCSFLH